MIFQLAKNWLLFVLAAVSFAVMDRSVERFITDEVRNHARRMKTPPREILGATGFEPSTC